MPNRIGFRRFIDAKKQITPFKFDPALVTFTAGMSKRNSAGPFAGGVMVQGKVDGSGICDRLVFPYGNQVAENFRQNIDPYQGSIVLWITPEWNGNDGLNHTLLNNSVAGAIGLLKDTAGNLKISLNGIADLASTSVVSWFAGTTYCVIARWDSKNTLDGTNYSSISINDVHTFGRTTSWVAPVSSTEIGVGATSSASPITPSNAILEGLTIFRRVLFDDSYGTDVGNGDEIALIYNAGTGKDPCEITGSWDVTFCLPTDSDTSTALVTG